MSALSDVRFTIVVAAVCDELHVPPVGTVYLWYQVALLPASVSVALLCVIALTLRPSISVAVTLGTETLFVARILASGGVGEGRRAGDEVGVGAGRNGDLLGRVPVAGG